MSCSFFQDDTVGTDSTKICQICGENFVRGQKKQQHFRTKTHQAAWKEFKKKKKEETRRDVVIFVITL
jgi:hypothetical protein